MPISMSMSMVSSCPSCIAFEIVRRLQIQFGQ
jgi:hypothetical protein